MNTLGDSVIWSYYGAQTKARVIKSPSIVRKSEGHLVRSYLELAQKMAALQFLNPDLVLMFRGQHGDHKNSQNNTTLKPTLFRSLPGSRTPPDPGILNERFEALERAERYLVQEYRAANPKLLGVERLIRHRMLRWAILQHYEVCPTPLLDVTHSLRIAASFASENAAGEAYLFVIGIPNVSGAITASAEAGLQVIRLASVCPPSALRPHIQEGYLLGEYPDMANYDQKELYGSYEIDFGRRLLAKFRFKPERFWHGDTFPKVANHALYPPEDKDPLFRLTQKVKTLADC